MSLFFAAPSPPTVRGRGRRYFRDKAQAPQIKVVKLPHSDCVPGGGGGGSASVFICARPWGWGARGLRGEGFQGSGQLEPWPRTRADKVPLVPEEPGAGQERSAGSEARAPVRLGAQLLPSAFETNLSQLPTCKIWGHSFLKTLEFWLFWKQDWDGRSSSVRCRHGGVGLGRRRGRAFIPGHVLLSRPGPTSW